MNTRDTCQQETQERFICLNKQQADWRMDGPMFTRFMRHVSDYFRICESDEGLDVDEVQYAEIANDDLGAVSLIFGGYAPDDTKILLVPIHPGLFMVPKSYGFRIHVRTKTQDATRSFRLRRN